MISVCGYGLLTLYFGLLLLLSMFSLHRYLMLIFYYRYKQQPSTPEPMTVFPRVTVQLPIFNERYVVDRLLESVSNLKYPQDRLQIQILDDSTDDTVELTRAWAKRLTEMGFCVEHINRTDRSGFKAGALQKGNETATGEFIAIFDADFVAPEDFLNKIMPRFADSKVGMVQMRWEHLNRNYSLLTQLQSIMIDGHFVIEHAARHYSGRFFNFNGTAGVWRKTAIADAGGWQHDTLTEDLDLSYRAQLRGWNFVYIPWMVAPAELPVEINAFKTQQHRWTKGSIQTALKLLPAIWRSKFPLGIKIEATFHLANNFAYLLTLMVSVLMLPVLMAREHLKFTPPIWVDVFLLFSATASIGTFYVASQREILKNWRHQIRFVPLMMSLGVGLCVNNAKAVLEALLGMQSDFVRTPKFGVRTKRDQWWRKRYAGAKSGVALIETLLALYYVVIVGYCIWRLNYYTLPFMLLFLFGFGYVGVLSLVSIFRPSAPEPVGVSTVGLPEVP